MTALKKKFCKFFNFPIFKYLENIVFHKIMLLDTLIYS